MKIVAIRECSAGNDSVGEMWKETKIFDPDTPLSEVVSWIGQETGRNIILTIADE